MKPTPEKETAEFAKVMTAACVRRGYLEKLHAGTVRGLKNVRIIQTVAE